MSSDPPSLGSHCSLPSCQALDFLPLPCQSPRAATRCPYQFCKLHALPESHHCASLPLTDGLIKGRFEDKFGALLPDKERGIGELKEKEDERLKRKEVARGIIEKNFGVMLGSGGSAGSVGGAGGGKKPLKKNPEIELRKLKARAKPCDTNKRALETALEDRVYFLIKFVDSDRKESVEKEFWLAKTTTVGKLLDLCAVIFKETNTNNISQDPAKLLSIAYSPTDEEPATLVSNSSKMDSVANGRTLWLLRGPL